MSELRSILGPVLDSDLSSSRTCPRLGLVLVSAWSWSRPGTGPGPVLVLARYWSWPGTGPGLDLVSSWTRLGLVLDSSDRLV